MPDFQKYLDCYWFLSVNVMAAVNNDIIIYCKQEYFNTRKKLTCEKWNKI